MKLEISEEKARKTAKVIMFLTPLIFAVGGWLFLQPTDRKEYILGFGIIILMLYAIIVVVWFLEKNQTFAKIFKRISLYFINAVIWASVLGAATYDELTLKAKFSTLIAYTLVSFLVRIRLGWWEDSPFSKKHNGMWYINIVIIIIAFILALI